jgi:hypothetical protein
LNSCHLNWGEFGLRFCRRGLALAGRLLLLLAGPLRLLAAGRGGRFGERF